MAQPLGPFLKENGQGLNVILVGVDGNPVDPGLAQNLLFERFKLGGFNPEAFRQRMASRSFSRLWIVNERKKLEPVFIRTGISDGTFTEIVRGRIKEGDEIVVGTNGQKQTAQQQTSPFGAQQRGPGGPRRF